MDDESLGRLARPLHEPALDALLDRVGDARCVLLGEASHGTREYYAWRAAITRRLVSERGFAFVAVEGDWPDCYALNRCVTHAPDAPDQPRAVLEAFDRWPRWMWANTDVAAFAEWLRAHNAAVRPARPVGFYGLDVYSLWESLRAIIGYLGEHHPDHLAAGLEAWRCFEPYAENPHEYAWATRLVPTSCEGEVVEMLRKLPFRAAATSAASEGEARFDAEQNAAVVAGAEQYYRTMVRGGAGAWNVRDRHMADTLDRLLHHHGPEAKAVVWAHNTHLGDARATDMAAAGMTNLGQLTRERYGPDEVVIVGFGGYRGSVIAADGWGGTPQRLPVPPAAEGSLEALLHRAGCDDALFVFPSTGQPQWLRSRRDHRAIGVVYHPARERTGNYVPTVLGRRYDAFCYFTDTEALEPLHLEAAQPHREQETYPSGR